MIKYVANKRKFSNGSCSSHHQEKFVSEAHKKTCQTRTQNVIFWGHLYKNRRSKTYRYIYELWIYFISSKHQGFKVGDDNWWSRHMGTCFTWNIENNIKLALEKSKHEALYLAQSKLIKSICIIFVKIYNSIVR